MRSAILVLAVTACSDLPPYQAECGNGVIDEHEDCDSGSGCLSCALICQSDGSCGSDAPGYVCGGDGLCHAPGGTFRTEAQGFPFNAPEFFVTDVNGDRVGDVIGVGATSLLVHHGVLYSGPGPQEVIQTPFLTGTPEITRFDHGPTTDLLLPTAQSVVAYTSPLQALAPYPFAIDASYQSAVPLDLFQFDAINIGLIGVNPSSQQLFYVTIDISAGKPSFVNRQDICSNVQASQFESMDVHDTSSNSTIEKLVAISGGGQGCVIKVTTPVPNSGPPLPGTAAELVQVQADHRLVLSAVTPGNPCPDAIDGLKAYPPTGGSPGFCGISTSTSTDLAALLTTSGLSPAMDEVAVGTVPLAPYYITGDAPEALATNYGIYAIGSSAAARIYHSDRLLDSVRSLDLDGDGDLDVAASAAGLDDIDFLYRFHPPAPASDGFQLVRYDTVAHPHRMFAADFDGNHATDLAYTERLPFGERLMVAYGTPDRPLAPIEMSVFRDVIELTPGFISTDPSGTLSDLSVLDYDAATSRPLLTLLHGSPDRTLVSTFDPRVQGAFGSGGPQPSALPTFAGVVAGRFGGDGSIGDLFSVVINDTNVIGYLGQATLGAFTLGGGTSKKYGELVKCGNAKAGSLCADGAHYLAWPVGDHDSILAVENRFSRGVTIEPQQQTLTADPALEQIAPPGTFVHSLRSVDVDGDGTAELVASYGADLAQRAASTIGNVLACHVDASAVITTCDDLATTISDKDGPAICVDAAPGLVGRYQRGESKPFPSPELVMACHRPMVGRTDIFRIAHDATGLHAVPLLQLTTNTTVERIFLGDVTGDGIDDLLALDVDPSTLVPILLVYRQCNSRDTDPECLP